MRPLLAIVLCAWVLWSEAPPGSGRWQLADALQVAFERRTDCERAASDLLDARAVAAAEAATKGQPLASVFWACLPDSIDPRGPKTGGAGR